jgi:hypothetical protein
VPFVSLFHFLWKKIWVS